MQGTVVMLMALSGLGCHNKYDVAYAPPTYGAFIGNGGCYANYYPNFMGSAVVAPSCYAPCYGGMYNGCYAAGYGGCYGGGYGARRHSCCFVSRLFGCCGCGNAGYGDPYAGYGYLGYGGPGPYMGGPGSFMGGPGPMMGGPGPMMGGPGFGAPYEPAIFGYALQFNYGDPTVDSVPVPTVQPPAPSASGATSTSPATPGGTQVKPARDTTTPPPPPPPSPANVPNANPPKPGV
jgi:hypothetical protein